MRYLVMLMLATSSSADVTTPAQEWINSVSRPGYVHLLLDTSCSMAGPRWDAARREAGALISSLPVGWHLQISTFADSAWTWSPEHRPMTPETRREAKAWIAAQPAGGRTTRYAVAIRTALDQQPGFDVPILVVVVSDGVLETNRDSIAAAELLGGEWKSTHRCILWIQVGVHESIAPEMVHEAQRGWRLSSQLAVVGE